MPNELWTPGPWEVSPEDDFFVLAFPGGVATIIADLDPIGQRTALEMEANARLIAAAPELFEAVSICLEAERERQVKLRPGSPASTYTERRIAKIEAALAKARGEP